MGFYLDRVSKTSIPIDCIFSDRKTSKGNEYLARMISEDGSTTWKWVPGSDLINSHKILSAYGHKNRSLDSLFVVQDKIAHSKHKNTVISENPASSIFINDGEAVFSINSEACKQTAKGPSMPALSSKPEITKIVSSHFRSEKRLFTVEINGKLSEKALTYTEVRLRAPHLLIDWIKSNHRLM